MAWQRCSEQSDARRAGQQVGSERVREKSEREGGSEQLDVECA